MDIESLKQIASKMMQKGKGILALDESQKTAGKRLESIGVENTEENRRKYRDLFLNTVDIESYVSGVILHEETLFQSNADGVLFMKVLEEKGIIPGIKVDKGAVDFPGFPEEKITEGLDGLRDRLKAYYNQGARFAKWRAVISIGDGLPTPECIHTNTTILARYARLCQEEGLVPVVEPEVLLSGTHTLEQSEKVTTEVLQTLFYQLDRYRVNLEAVILKTSMVLPGDKSGIIVTPERIAEATVQMLKKSVPDNIPGVVFLSGGQGVISATEHLDAIADLEPFPWEIAFSYARAIQAPALKVWQGQESNIEEAQHEFIKRLSMNVAADAGVYTKELE